MSKIFKLIRKYTIGMTQNVPSSYDNQTQRRLMYTRRMCAQWLIKIEADYVKRSLEYIWKMTVKQSNAQTA